MSGAIGSRAEDGRLSAAIVWGLFLLSIPSATIFAILGVIVAYVQRRGAAPLSRAHLTEQIRLFWAAFFWGAALLVATIVSNILKLVLIGYPMMWMVGIIGFLVMVWFTVKSLIGLLRLLDGRAP